MGKVGITKLKFNATYANIHYIYIYTYDQQVLQIQMKYVYYSFDFLLVDRIICSIMSHCSGVTFLSLLNSPANERNSPPSNVTVSALIQHRPSRLPSGIQSAESTLGFNWPRCDAIHTDALPAPFSSKGLHHGLHTRLGTRTRHHETRPLIGIVGRDCKENSATLCFNHPLPHIQCQEGCTLEHNIQDCLKGISRETLRWGYKVSSRIVNNHRRDSKFLFNLVHSYFYCFWVSDIQLNRKDSASSCSFYL